jgi:hypothetical protein
MPPLIIYAVSEIEILTFFERFGLPTIILMVFAYFVAQSIKWFGVNVVVPMKDRHIDFLGKLENCIDKIADTQVDIRDNIGLIKADIDKVCSSTTSVKSDSKILKEKIEGLNTLIMKSVVQNGKYDSSIVGHSAANQKKEA